MKTLTVAPDRSDNPVEAREFQYLAEVDILGWKFTKAKNGALLVTTPTMEPEGQGGYLLAVLSPQHQALLQALMALVEPERGEIPDSWENVGL